MVPSWIPSIIRHLIFRVPKRDHNIDNHPYRHIGSSSGQELRIHCSRFRV